VEHEPASEQVDALVTEVARELERELEELNSDVCALLIERIPALNVPEEDVRELLVASVHSNLATALHTLAHQIPVEQIDVPAAAAYYARRVAQRDIPQDALLRAYRLGEARFNQWWLRELGGRHPDPDLLIAAVRHAMRVTSAYIDTVSQNLIEIYAEEQQLWAQRTGASRAVQVREVLQDETLDAAAAESLTGYRMTGPHVGLVAWTPREETVRKVESAIQVITGATGQQPLAVLADDHTLWAWASGPCVAELSVEQLRTALDQRNSGAKIALGNPLPGLTGFRASHQQALRAQQVAEIHGGRAGAVTTFAEVAMSSFLAGDLAGARRWVADVLGCLAGDDDATAELRRTVLAYLRAGSSLIDAAAQLHLHKNTVRYRLRKAEDVRGSPISERRVDLEVALQACAHLGRTVLGPAPPP
jgi:DNA-binding PucR family transcriptional regulator